MVDPRRRVHRQCAEEFAVLLGSHDLALSDSAEIPSKYREPAHHFVGLQHERHELASVVRAAECAFLLRALTVGCAHWSSKMITWICGFALRIDRSRSDPASGTSPGRSMSVMTMSCGSTLPIASDALVVCSTAAPRSRNCSTHSRLLLGLSSTHTIDVPVSHGRIVGRSSPKVRRNVVTRGASGSGVATSSET